MFYSIYKTTWVNAHAAASTSVRYSAFNSPMSNAVSDAQAENRKN